jgi:hypothetical protein
MSHHTLAELIINSGILDEDAGCDCCSDLDDIFGAPSFSEVSEVILDTVSDFSSDELEQLASRVISLANHTRDKEAAERKAQEEKVDELSLVDQMAIDSAVNRLGGSFHLKAKAAQLVLDGHYTSKQLYSMRVPDLKAVLY